MILLMGMFLITASMAQNLFNPRRVTK
jgi:hypothetical protein